MLCFWSQGNEGANDRSPKQLDYQPLFSKRAHAPPRKRSRRYDCVQNLTNKIGWMPSDFADVNYKQEVSKFGSPPNIWQNFLPVSHESMQGLPVHACLVVKKHFVIFSKTIYIHSPIFSHIFIWFLNVQRELRENWTPAQNGRLEVRGGLVPRKIFLPASLAKPNPNYHPHPQLFHTCFACFFFRMK